MMYKNKLAVALKSAGKVLREFKDSVYVPFGNEYSIFIKNLNSVRALVTVTVDGVDVGDGTRFVVDANDTIDIERFIKNGNFDEGNRLKFIERTGNIEDHRGVGIEDGLVRVEFNFEKPYVQQYYPYIPPRRSRWDDNNIFYTTNAGSPSVRDGLIGSTSNVLRGQSTFTASNSVGEAKGAVQDSVNVNFVATGINTVDMQQKIANADVNEILNEVENDVGITVPGSISDQQFKTASWFPTETETHVVVLKILGETKDNVKVKKAVTVRAKPKCETCNRTNKATAKFCTECGTSLNIV